MENTAKMCDAGIRTRPENKILINERFLIHCGLSKMLTVLHLTKITPLSIYESEKSSYVDVSLAI